LRLELRVFQLGQSLLGMSGANFLGRRRELRMSNDYESLEWHALFGG